MFYSYRILGRRDAAVGTGLENRLLADFKFRNLRLEIFDFFVLAYKIAVQDINNLRLLVQYLKIGIVV